MSVRFVPVDRPLQRQLVACQVFVLFVRGASPARWRIAPRVATAEHFASAMTAGEQGHWSQRSGVDLDAQRSVDRLRAIRRGDLGVAWNLGR